MSENLNRILTLLEHLSSAKEEGMQIAQLVERTGLASSTVYRLVHDLEALGLLRKTEDRRLFPKFTFEQDLVVGGLETARLAESCRAVSEKLITASEFISLRKQNLFWHIAHEHAQQPIRLRASVGFIRGSYELDCISRMALAHVPIVDLEAGWDVSGFYDVGVSGGKVQWAQARAQVEAVKTDDMQFDLMGNAKGVRRYCVAINGSDGQFAGLLTAAEAATPLRDVDGHVAKVREVLFDVKNAVGGGGKDLVKSINRYG
jgi:DNA-binding IclR family transcriptional regulator